MPPSNLGLVPQVHSHGGVQNNVHGGQMNTIVPHMSNNTIVQLVLAILGFGANFFRHTVSGAIGNNTVPFHHVNSRSNVQANSEISGSGNFNNSCSNLNNDNNNFNIGGSNPNNNSGSFRSGCNSSNNSSNFNNSCHNFNIGGGNFHNDCGSFNNNGIFNNGGSNFHNDYWNFNNNGGCNNSSGNLTTTLGTLEAMVATSITNTTMVAKDICHAEDVTIVHVEEVRDPFEFMSPRKVRCPI
eukprot:Gb_15514 [translate_table: standard]